MLLANLLADRDRGGLAASCSATCAAIAIATLFVHRKTIEMAFFPIVVLINSIPVVAKAPILVLLLGNGMAPKIAIAAIICFFPTLVNMVRGLEAVSPQALELMHVLSAQQVGDVHPAAAADLGALSVLRAEDRRQHRGGRRDRRRVDRLAGGHRRADHPGDLQFRQRVALRDRRLRLGCSRCCSSWPSACSSALCVRWAPAEPWLSERRRHMLHEHLCMSRPATLPRGVAAPTSSWSAAARPGFSAAVAAARQGASVCLVERYPYLGGLASGGMVLVLDDMCAGAEITVRGICGELVERMRSRGLAVYPPEHERGHDPAMYRKWSRWGLFDFNTRTKPHPICYAVAFDPDGWKRASDDMVQEAGIELRLHSRFAGSIVEDGRIDRRGRREQGRARRRSWATW